MLIDFTWVHGSKAEDVFYSFVVWMLFARKFSTQRRIARTLLLCSSDELDKSGYHMLVAGTISQLLPANLYHLMVPSYGRIGAHTGYLQRFQWRIYEQFTKQSSIYRY